MKLVALSFCYKKKKEKKRLLKKKRVDLIYKLISRL